MTEEKCRFELHSRRKTVYIFVCTLDHGHEKKYKGLHPKGMYFIDMNDFWGPKQPGTPITAHDFTLRLHYFPDRPHYGNYPRKRA